LRSTRLTHQNHVLNRRSVCSGPFRRLSFRAEAVLAKAREAYKARDYRWVAELVNTRGVRRSFILAIIVAVIITTGTARAGELGHYNPGVYNIRDFVIPEPGFYGLLYNYFYTSDKLNDKNGNKIDTVTIRRGEATLKTTMDIDIYALVPVFMWSSPCEFLGARYTAYISPSFATSSLGASLNASNGRGISREIDSSFGVGDLFVQPVWLDWSLKHFDFALAYGFYAPVGRYNLETVSFPVIGPRTVEAADNIGLGFWTHQFQWALVWYPWENKGTAFVAALTYEVNQKKEGFDITPGSHLTLNWGISQYLPITRDKLLLAEIGPTGYSQWKMTGDIGTDTINGDVLDQVHAVGGQVGLTYLPWKASLNLHYYYEFASEARFQGQALNVSLAVKF